MGELPERMGGGEWEDVTWDDDSEDMSDWSGDGQWDDGRAVQVDPMKPTLKAPGPQRLKLEFDGMLSNFAFTFNLRRYTMARWAGNGGGARRVSSVVRLRRMRCRCGWTST